MRKSRVYSLLFLTMIALLAAAPVGYAGDDGDHKGGHDDGSPYPDFSRFFRLDCRFHNDENIHGIKFCYASAVYQVDNDRKHREIQGLQLGVGCDHQTIYNDKGTVQVETTLDRISPRTSATPAVEVFPQGQLDTIGTYSSVLDLHLGRLKGLCYVKKLKKDKHHDHDRDDDGDDYAAQFNWML